jgi:transposase-like protein
MERGETRGPRSAAREEIRRLRREVKQLLLEREILAKAAAWFARETGWIYRSLRVYRGMVQPSSLTLRP